MCTDSMIKQFVQNMAAIAFCPQSFVFPAWLARGSTNPTGTAQILILFVHVHVEGWHSSKIKEGGGKHL